MANATPPIPDEMYQDLRALVQDVLIPPGSGRTGFDSDRWLENWLRQPQPGLAGLTPAEMLRQRYGLAIVRRLLGSLASGAYQS